MTILTKNFTLEELTHSETATRLDIPNEPSPEELANLHELANVLQDVRDRLGKPILISSGYRSPALNRLIGGSKTSAHMKGLAADFICPSYGTPLQVCEAIYAMQIPFDQLIHEGNKWVHLGLPREGTPYRQQLLTAKFPGPVYVPGLVAA